MRSDQSMSTLSLQATGMPENRTFKLTATGGHNTTAFPIDADLRLSAPRNSPTTQTENGHVEQMYLPNHCNPRHDRRCRERLERPECGQDPHGDAHDPDPGGRGPA